jgi:hypothetical protein
MQSTDVVVFEGKEALRAFAVRQGFVDELVVQRQWAPGPVTASEPVVASEEVTFTFQLTPPSSVQGSNYPALLLALDSVFDEVFKRNASSIEGWCAPGAGLATLVRKGGRSPEGQPLSDQVFFDIVIGRPTAWAREAYSSVAEGLQELLERSAEGLGVKVTLHDVSNRVVLASTASRVLFRPVSAVAKPRYVIRYSDGAYNRGVGLQNGFPADLTEATRYDLDEARERLVDLMDAEIVDARTIRGSAEYDPLVPSTPAVAAAL